ncbi:hypothetical protein, partial [uncultured Granulicatella sp.]|uniref:hypothetical protein n=1 Tax=uncultured Granulicatella sp. TaxID=316089 RepID=UPI0028048D80
GKATDFDSVIRWFESSYPSPTGTDSGAFFVARFFCTNLFFPTVDTQTFFQSHLLKPFGISCCQIVIEQLKKMSRKS